MRACEAGCCQRFFWNPADVRWSSLPSCWSCPERWGPGSPARHAQAASSLLGLTALGWSSLQIAGSATQPATKTQHKFHHTPKNLTLCRKLKRGGMDFKVLCCSPYQFCSHSSWCEHTGRRQTWVCASQTSWGTRCYIGWRWKTH